MTYKRYKNLDEVRAGEIESFIREGYQVIAADFGVRPLTHDDWRDHPDFRREWFFCSAARTKYSLWALVERQDGYRAARVSSVWEFSDHCLVVKKVWESSNPDDFDVPLSVYNQMCPDDAGANPQWRERVKHYWQPVLDPIPGEIVEVRIKPMRRAAA